MGFDPNARPQHRDYAPSPPTLSSLYVRHAATEKDGESSQAHFKKEVPKGVVEEAPSLAKGSEQEEKPKGYIFFRGYVSHRFCFESQIAPFRTAHLSPLFPRQQEAQGQQEAQDQQEEAEEVKK